MKEELIEDVKALIKESNGELEKKITNTTQQSITDMASMILAGMKEIREDMKRDRGGGDEVDEGNYYSSLLEYNGTMSNEVKEFIERLRIRTEIIDYRTYGYENEDVLSLTDRQKATNMIIYEYLSIIGRNNKIKIVNSQEACILTHKQF